MLPSPTDRLAFRCMTDHDIDDMCRLLGDPEVMRYYPQPKSRAEVQQWIDWSRNSYAEHGFGLWIIEDRARGEFVGDCGLTMQRVDDEPVLEVGYHVLPAHQGKGFATEAAATCVHHGLEVLGAPMVTAIINPENLASRRVAEHIGLTLWKNTRGRSGEPIVVYASGARPS
jgi:RimJ/RimL family protein N-acetyltransferase